MLYYLFEYLETQFQVPGATLFGFLTFRAALAMILSLLISTIYGKRIIRFLQKKQMGETIRDLGLEGQKEKAGTPTMGGIIIILATLIPVLLLAKLENIYIILLIVTTLWMGVIGFIDDYLKKFKNDKDGLKGRFKVLGQMGLGIIVGATLFFHQDVTMKEKLPLELRQELLAQNPKIEPSKLFEEEAKSIFKLSGIDVIDLNLDLEKTSNTKTMLYDFKVNMNYFLGKYMKNFHIQSLKDIIDFNLKSPKERIPYGQSIFLASERTSGNLREAEYHDLFKSNLYKANLINREIEKVDSSY